MTLSGALLTLAIDSATEACSVALLTLAWDPKYFDLAVTVVTPLEAEE